MKPAALESSRAIVVGAGLSGIYMAIKLRGLGYDVVVLEKGAGVGGTWFWNRYPGARCDVESRDYSYSFSQELQTEWTWSERFASQPEIRDYLDHVVDRFSLRDAIEFNTEVVSCRYDDGAGTWNVAAANGRVFRAQFLMLATGCLSTPQLPSFPGADEFEGQVLHTGSWPETSPDLGGRDVAVIGTGSSGIQIVPEIAPLARRLYVLQRTPTYSVPSRNHPLTGDDRARIVADYPARRAASKTSRLGYPLPLVTAEYQETSALDHSEDERNRAFELAWEYGGPPFTRTFADLLQSAEANETAAEFVRSKIAEAVRDPATAKALSPSTYPIGAKRICVDGGYYDAFNRSNVELVDLQGEPILGFTRSGLVTEHRDIPVDTVVFATGFDAMTGTLLRMEIVGRAGVRLADRWAAGPLTFLGLMVSGFPNLFVVAGPGSPSVFAQMFLAAEHHVDYLAELLEHMRQQGHRVVEADPSAEQAWVAEVNGLVEGSLLLQANSWYLGANVPGKPRVFMPYPGGFDRYRRTCEEVAARGYDGFVFGAV